MGMKVHVLYGKPTDPAAFEEYYRTVHAPIGGEAAEPAGLRVRQGAAQSRRQ